MTHFLMSDVKPDGMKLEDILSAIRRDILYRCTKIMEDSRPEAKHVLENNIEILSLLSDAIKLAEDSTHTLDKAFGTRNVDGPRIGDG
ncbi:hypothetical protein [Hwanghaeella sp.]|uniref:hypothetical protein n=1 Tax=Hwanghaeella sp. TaxID=2605943 RepID=UPI003CCBD5F1